MSEPSANQPPKWSTAHSSLGRWRSSPAQRRTLLASAFGAICFLILSTTAYLWTERSRLINEAGLRGAQHTSRLAQDLEQTLKVAQTVIAQFDEQIQTSSTTPFNIPVSSDSVNLAHVLAALPLPFEMHALGAEGDSVTVVGLTTHSPPSYTGLHNSTSFEAIGRWGLGLNGEKNSPAHDTIPLSWRAAPNLHGVTAYGVDLSCEATQAWLERDRLNSGDRISLFWIHQDGTATLLASSPMAPEVLGPRLSHDWVPFAEKATQGSLNLISPLDGIERRIAFQKLSGASSSLVIIHGTEIETVLATWTAQLPWFIGVALLLTAAMTFGARRLDRSLRALSKSEQQFELVLGSGHVWDWSIKERTMRYAPQFIIGLDAEGIPPSASIDALFSHMVPEDGQRLKAAITSHIQSKTPYAEKFRTIDPSGKIRWFETQGQAYWDERGRPQYMAGTTFEITERLALEERQRQTLQNLHTVANASSILFWTADLEGKMDWVNQRWLDFTGRSLEQEIGQCSPEGIHSADLAARKNAMEATVRDGKPHSVEYRLRHANGTFHWIMEQCTPKMNADGELAGYIGSCIDRSELKQAEDAAKKRGAMLEGMFQVMQDLLFVLDRDGRFLHFQGSTQEHLYVPPESFLGKTIQEVMPTDIAQLIRSQLQFAEDGRLQEFDYALALPDGLHHFDARMAKLPGNKAQFMVVARDTTEREELRLQGVRLQRFMTIQARLATNFINLPVSEMKPAIDLALREIGDFAKADRAYIFNYNFETSLASNSHEWCGPGIEPAKDNLQDIDLDFFRDWVDNHVAGKTMYFPDVEMLPPGSMRDLLTAQGIRSLIALPMNSGEKCLGFVGFDSVKSVHLYDEAEMGLLQMFAQMLVNIYERQASEAELVRFTDELEQMVSERTAQLDVSVRELQTANKELESFAYSVSHDLKSPLRNIEGFASLLLEEHASSLNPQGRQHLERIQRSMLQMSRLISDLLEYFHVTNFEKSLEPVQLLDCATHMFEGFRNEIDLRGAQVKVDVDPDLAVLAHPQGLTMVLRNLVDNAFKFSKPYQSPVITLSARRDGNFVRLCLKDDGLGFDMVHHNRIFEIFQRLHRQEQVVGTGIGLAMVHKAVQRMNGRIWAESSLGNGAKFHIELPRA